MGNFLIEQENIGAIIFDKDTLKILKTNDCAGKILDKPGEYLLGLPLKHVVPLHRRLLIKIKNASVKNFGIIVEDIVFLDEKKPIMSTFVFYEHKSVFLFFLISDLASQGNPFFLTQLRYFFKNLEFFGIMLDQRGIIKFCSQTLCTFTGYRLEEVLGMDFFDLFIDSNKSDFFKFQLDLLFKNKHIPQTIQIGIKDKNDHLMDVLWNLKFILNGKNDLIGVSAIGIDLLSLDLQSKKKKKFRDNLESVIAQISSMFARTPSYKVDETINKALEIVGEYADVDRSYVFLFHENQQLMDNTHEWCRQGIEAQIENLQTVPSKTFPWWMKHLLRREIIHIPQVNELPPEAESEKEILQAQDIISLIVVPMLDKDELIGFIGFDSVRAPKFWTDEDINLLKIVSSIFVSSLKRKATELSLADSERKYRTLFRAAPDLIFILNDKGEITSLNPAFKTITRQEVENWIGKPFKNLILDDEAEFDLRFHQCMKGQIPAPLELKLQTADGYRITEIICSPLTERGARKGIYGIARDITERRILEENLRHAERMKSLGVLAGGIAHDFNNILGILLGNYTILKEITPAHEDLQLPLHDIKQAIERGKNLVQNLLTFARKKEPKYEILNLNEEIRHITTLLRQTTPKSIYFDLRLSDVPLYIYSDRVQIHQILINLCLNAIDAIHAQKNHGVITITTSPEKELGNGKHSEIGKSGVHLNVTDDGIGMDEQQKKFIFDPFYTTKETGTGLGLAVVFGALKGMNGRIKVESTPHKGTTFHLYFPAAHPEKSLSKKEETVRKTEKVGHANIFLVEDDALLSQMLQYILKRRHYNVVSAYTGTDAVRLFSERQKKINMVILDFDLPEKDGFEVARSLRKINDQIKILMTSGYIEPPVKQKIEQLGNIFFVEKPYDPEGLLEKIVEILKKN